jgi:hypothetical protein
MLEVPARMRLDDDDDKEDVYRGPFRLPGSGPGAPPIPYRERPDRRPSAPVAPTADPVGPTPPGPDEENPVPRRPRDDDSSA